MHILLNTTTSYQHYSESVNTKIQIQNVRSDVFTYCFQIIVSMQPVKLADVQQCCRSTVSLSSATQWPLHIREHCIQYDLIITTFWMALALTSFIMSVGLEAQVLALGLDLESQVLGLGFGVEAQVLGLGPWSWGSSPWSWPLVLRLKSLLLALVLRVKSLVLALVLRVKSLVLALVLRIKSLVLALALRLKPLALALALGLCVVDTASMEGVEDGEWWRWRGLEDIGGERMKGRNGVVRGLRATSRVR